MYAERQQRLYRYVWHMGFSATLVCAGHGHIPELQ